MVLVILAHFAVTLEEVGETWWAYEWGSRLIQEVSQVLSVEWKDLMAWPMDKITLGNSNK